MSRDIDLSTLTKAQLLAYAEQHLPGIQVNAKMTNNELILTIEAAEQQEAAAPAPTTEAPSQGEGSPVAEDGVTAAEPVAGDAPDSDAPDHDGSTDREPEAEDDDYATYIVQWRIKGLFDEPVEENDSIYLAAEDAAPLLESGCIVLATGEAA